MPWMCQFPRGAKARLDNQFVCSDESHVAEADGFVLWSGWTWFQVLHHPVESPVWLSLSGPLEVSWKTEIAPRYQGFWQFHGLLTSLDGFPGETNHLKHYIVPRDFIKFDRFRLISAMLVWICNGNNLYAQFLGFSGCILMLQIAVIRTTIYILVFPPLVRSFKGKDSHCTRTLNIEQELSFKFCFQKGLRKITRILCNWLKSQHSKLCACRFLALFLLWS